MFQQSFWKKKKKEIPVFLEQTYLRLFGRNKGSHTQWVEDEPKWDSESIYMYLFSL